MPRQRVQPTPSPHPDPIVILRASPQSDGFAHLAYAGVVTTYASCCLYGYSWAVLSWIENAPLIKAQEILVFLWKIVFSHGAIQMPVSIRGDLGIVLCQILYTAIAVFFTRKLILYLRDAWEMHQYGRVPSPERLRWNYLRQPRPPMWIVTHHPLVAPSPTDVLAVTQATEHELLPPREALYPAMISPLEDPPAPPLIRYRIVVRESLTITLLGQDGTQETLMFEHPQWTALIAYLALQPPGTWVPRDHLLNNVYGSLKRAALASHIHRMNNQLSLHACQVGMIPEDAEKKPAVKLALLVLDEKAHAWRLTPDCEVAVYPELQALASQMDAVREHPETLSREHIQPLFQAGEHCAAEYGEGLLVAHQAYESLWSWAREAHLRIRDRWLETLSSLATVLTQQLNEQPLRAEEREQLQREAMEVYRWKALTALGRLPKIDEAEPALRQCLALCYHLRDIVMGVEVFQAFSQRMQYLDYRWQPSPETVHIWPEVTSRARPTSRRTRRKNPPWLA